MLNPEMEAAAATLLYVLLDVLIFVNLLVLYRYCELYLSRMLMIFASLSMILDTRLMTDINR